MAQLGRISGGILRDNLERQGINLNFANVQNDVTNGIPLLHLDVNNSKIGINTDNPISVIDIPQKENAFRTRGLVSPYVNLPVFSIQDSEITPNNGVGNILLTSADVIFATAIATANLNFNNNTISSYTSDTDIELRPDNTGTINIGNIANKTDLNITGNLHATGNITFGGNLTLGDNNTDSVNFVSDVNSDITPTDNNAYNLGSSLKTWANLFSNELSVQTIFSESLDLEDISPERRQGNILYVSENGSDSNQGDHQSSPFSTIKHALAVAESNLDLPAAIYLFPGVYVEDFPLSVPPNVSVVGHSLRNTVVTPTTLTQSNDCFLLQQGNTIENITVKDFYFDSQTNTGYAFRFVNNGLITSRSPYIRNVTIITKGSTTSANDPRGFDSGDAGKGAFINGAELNTASTEASMLFASATFFTPGVDAITMTNGVRVEWINCFTYFANKGLYAVEGTVGRPTSAGTRFGAELRSIGSANIYGNTGAVADGPSCLMYLISHNLAYIGTKGDSSNDDLLVLQANEVIELNFGKIYYNSTDALGTYRVGDQFFVDSESGTTSINAELVNFSGVGAITINTGGLVTFINGERIDTGNIRVAGNTITNIADNLIISPLSGIVDLKENKELVISRGDDTERTFIPGNIRYNIASELYEGYSSANLAFGGVYSDDRLTSLEATNFSNELILTANGLEVGKMTNTELSLHGFSTSLVLFDDNQITSTVANGDINLDRDGTGVVNVFDINFSNQTILNKSNDALVLGATNRGYIKFDSTSALLIPAGTTIQRGTPAEVGFARWNTDTQLLEVWTGNNWVDPETSASTAITDDDFIGILDIYTLIFG